GSHRLNCHHVNTFERYQFIDILIFSVCSVVNLLTIRIFGKGETDVWWQEKGKGDSAGQGSDIKEEV
ncbi:MAG: hypothetical protein QME44_11125, partial [Thermodesulfobacteriota bacterium]|nr:hypothetical protein [Thermodesulfobacteriota bacterium]